MVEARNGQGVVARTMYTENGEPAQIDVDFVSTAGLDQPTQTLFNSSLAGVEDQAASSSSEETLVSLEELSDLLTATAGGDRFCEPGCSQSETCFYGECISGSNSTGSDSVQGLARCPESTNGFFSLDRSGAPAGECSGHGQCARTPAGCSPTSSQSCAAACLCNQGWTGSGCQRAMGTF